ncbi:CinA family protein [Sandarakinorhabdus oryzae]|uniref:CinA family protein n=1 Tax=Sandarakinorhabdus oryzae TaxID=2675220 RepID=UPI0012E16A56|nr:CinA family protein [Sandarakinorhabdus oryzae]
MTMEPLFATAARIGAQLKSRRETIAVAESAAGGLISAALLSVPGASAFYLGGAVVYTPRARHRLLGLRREDVRGFMSATEPFALLMAETIRKQHSVTWGIGETGAAGPDGNPYGHAAGHDVVAVSGPVQLARTIATGSSDRQANMVAFAAAALALLEEQLG